MPLEDRFPSLADRAAALNAASTDVPAREILSRAMEDVMIGRLALVSSFGAEAAVLLHMISTLDRTTPVIFADTEMLFEETLTYQEHLSDHLRLTDVRRVRPSRADLLTGDVDGILHVFDPNACCHLRKVAPVEAALTDFDAWITGRKRIHGGRRASLRHFEAGSDGRLKINPLAFWSAQDIAEYMSRHDLPRHPLVEKGFSSLGCMPCTTPSGVDETPRSGRWRGLPKTECGLHLAGPGAV